MKNNMNLEEISKRCKSIREEMSVTRYRVSEDAHLNRDIVKAIDGEHGDTGYNIKSLISYCEALNIEVKVQKRSGRKAKTTGKIKKPEGNDGS
jgi:DNA-binding XRE family transcriptional regulator